MFDRGLGTGVRAIQSGERSKEGSDYGDDFAFGVGFDMERGFFDEEVGCLGVDGKPIISGLAP
jgi:hypothetical protein